MNKFAKNTNIMASVRDLKKALKKTISTLALDALMVQQIKGEKVKNEINDILSELTIIEKDLVYKINHVPSKNKKEIKKHFTEIHNKISSSISGIQERLNKLME
ncbi:MAG: hypothetical protein N3A01_05210 [Bacteroidales bacterium]|nr:hypothetical protein [Bacteroidales bacterium]